MSRPMSTTARSSASLPPTRAKGKLPVRKVKSRQKLAEATPGLVQAGMQLAQATIVYYYGYWFDDGVDDWYYWFPADVVIVDETWVEYIA
jgi:hypothetical protein